MFSYSENFCRVPNCIDVKYLCEILYFMLDDMQTQLDGICFQISAFLMINTWQPQFINFIPLLMFGLLNSCHHKFWPIWLTPLILILNLPFWYTQNHNNTQFKAFLPYPNYNWPKLVYSIYSFLFWFSSCITITNLNIFGLINL